MRLALRRPRSVGCPFRITGDGIRTTRTFRLYAEPGSKETVVVESTSQPAYVAGITAIVLGSVGLTAGAVLFDFGHVITSCESEDGVDSGGRCELAEPSLVGIGVATMIASAVVLVTGASLAITQSSSSVTQQVASATPRPFVAARPVFEARSSENAAGALAGIRSNATPVFSISF